MRSSLLLVALFVSVSALAVPSQLTHQGRLLDSVGTPLEGQHELVVRVYAAAAGGSELWSDTITTSFEGGAYSVVLGANPSNPIPASTLDGSVRYVSVAVDGTPELSPRIPVTSVPYAVRAGLADVASSVQGGIVDASEIRIGGSTVISADGAISGAVAWADVEGVPSNLEDGDDDTLAGLACASGEIAVWSGLEWACGAGVPSSIDVATLSGTIAIQNLPVGTGSEQVAPGDHLHSFSQITGMAAYSQLPTGTAPSTVAAGDHGHALAALTGDLPLTRTTGDLPLTRTTGDLPLTRTTGDLPLARTTGNLDAARLTGTVAVANLPLGTSSTSVSRGDHAHAFNQITGAATVSQLPTGTTSSTVALGNHSHDISSLSGVAGVSQLPVGTSSTTVARGDHGHTFAQVSGVAAFAQLPTGTSGTTVAIGNHVHAAADITTGTMAKARLPSDTMYAPTCTAGQFAQANGSGGWTCVNPLLAEANKPWFVAGDSTSVWQTCANQWVEATYNLVGAGNAGGWYNAGNGRFTAPVRGVYLAISSHYVHASSSGLAYVHHQLGVNGNQLSGGGQPNNTYNIVGLNTGASEGTYSTSSAVSRVLTLNAGDYVSSWVYCGGSGAYRYGAHSYYSVVLLHAY